MIASREVAASSANATASLSIMPGSYTRAAPCAQGPDQCGRSPDTSTRGLPRRPEPPWELATPSPVVTGRRWDHHHRTLRGAPDLRDERRGQGAEVERDEEGRVLDLLDARQVRDCPAVGAVRRDRGPVGRRRGREVSRP